MNLLVYDRLTLEKKPLPEKAMVFSCHDPGTRFPSVQGHPVGWYIGCFHDISEPMPGLTHPTEDHARSIIALWRKCEPLAETVICQCEAGCGRSQAIAAAFLRLSGKDDGEIISRGTYNRLLYRLLLQVEGQEPKSEPKVAVVVRAKYPYDRLDAFNLSLERQRYENWLCIALGPEEYWCSAKYSAIKTTGRELWGHPYRQAGIDAALEAGAEMICLQNDDNYLTPGYLEQLVFALEQGYDLAICQCLHNYHGYQVAGSDLGCFMARADLIRKHPWTGTHFTADREYIKTLAEGARVVRINRPLFVHN